MSIIVEGSSFMPAPQGVHAGVCVDVRDIGTVETPWGKKAKIAIVWEIEAVMEDGRRFVISKWYTKALNDKSNLFKDLTSWRGKAFTPEELKGFDVEKVIGAPCQLVVVHAQKKNGGVRSSVTAVVTAPKDKRLAPSGQFIRWKDRPENQQRPNAGHGGGEGGPYEDDGGESIPF